MVLLEEEMVLYEGKRQCYSIGRRRWFIWRKEMIICRKYNYLDERDGSLSSEWEGFIWRKEKVLAAKSLFYLKGGRKETVYLKGAGNCFLLEVDGFNCRKETVLSERRRWFFLRKEMVLSRRGRWFICGKFLFERTRRFFCQFFC